jgi:hypothetical protein
MNCIDRANSGKAQAYFSEHAAAEEKTEEIRSGGIRQVKFAHD